MIGINSMNNYWKNIGLWKIWYKTTLYRLAKDSKVVEALIAAAKNGKKVTVVIELLARFDDHYTSSSADFTRKIRKIR